jgi:hypothetical protein
MTGAERARLMARVLDDHPELAELVPERLRAAQQSLRQRPNSRMAGAVS